MRITQLKGDESRRRTREAGSAYLFAVRAPRGLSKGRRSTPSARNSKEDRVRIHGTKVLGRLNGEIKRRTNVVYILGNESAVWRLLGAFLMEQNDEYAIQNRYMSLESLATISENRMIRLPTVSALA
jgi:hypothetical protein